MADSNPQKSESKGEEHVVSTAEDFGAAGYLPGSNRTLYVTYDSITFRSGKITEADRETVVYEFEIHMRRPQIRLRRPGSSNQIATAEFHQFSRKIEFAVNGQESKLKSKNWKYCDLQWNSPTFGGQTMTWRRKTMWVILDQFLLDEKDLPVAKFSPYKGKSIKTGGAIEIMDGNVSQEVLDEIVTTGMAVMQDTIYYTVINAT